MRFRLGRSYDRGWSVIQAIDDFANRKGQPKDQVRLHLVGKLQNLRLKTASSTEAGAPTTTQNDRHGLF